MTTVSNATDSINTNVVIVKPEVAAPKQDNALDSSKVKENEQEHRNGSKTRKHESSPKRDFDIRPNQGNKNTSESVTNVLHKRSQSNVEKSTQNANTSRRKSKGSPPQQENKISESVTES